MNDICKQDPAYLLSLFIVSLSLMMNRSLKILVIDHNSSTRDTLVDYLQQIGAEKVYIASDGEEAAAMAFDHAKNQAFDLIFSDIELPKISGIELLQKLRDHQSYSTTPIIMVTKENSVSTVLEAIESGADEYIVKPYEKSIIELKIQSALENVKVT